MCGRNERPFFEANILGSEFNYFFFESSELLKFPRTQVDTGVFLNDSNCYCQTICSEEIVHRASFLTGEFLLTSLLVRVVVLLQWRVAQILQTTCWKDCILQRSELLLAVTLFGTNCPSRFFSDGRECFRSYFWWALNSHDLFVTSAALVGL